jgi:4-cresol dehydrogenase (hydroxylating) flavoprotein subunit
MKSNNTSAIQEFKDAIGEADVITDENTLTNFQTTTFATTQTIPAIIRPASREEVQECLRIANRHKIPIYPISSGKNIGYGGRVPTADGCIVMELKRLDKIVDYNDKLGYVTLQPGVTQRMLYNFLQEKQSAFWMDATGAPMDHSIIGNISERGFGHTPYGDHFGNVSGMEVVLPNGDCIHTGQGRFKGAKATPIYRWGVGPYIDGLFTQSNLGIITELTVWLMPAPAYHQSFFFSTGKYEDLANLIDILRPLFLDGTIKSAMHLGNDHKVLSSIQGYPWEKTGGQTPLPDKVLHDLGKTWDFGAWNAVGALYGTRQEVALARRKIKKQLRKAPIKKLRFLDDFMINLADQFKLPLKWILRLDIPEMLRFLKPVYGLAKGVPTDDFIPSLYWRKPGGAPKTPDLERDRCGLLWIAPIAPTDGEYAEEIWKITKNVFAQYGYEPAVSITLLTERAMDSIISITYDRDISGEDEKAMQCHDELLKQLTDKGYFPYRLGVQAMGKLPEPELEYQMFMQRLKAGLDPNAILAPNRYPQ